MELEPGQPGLLEAILDSVADYAVMVLDTDGAIRIWSTGAERLFQYREDEILRRPADVLYIESDVQQVVPQQERDATLEHGRTFGLRVYRRRDGMTFWAEGTTALMRDGTGEPLGYVKILRDATDRQRETAQLLQLARVDPLTGLNNRIALAERLKEAAEAAMRHDRSLIVQMIDLDHFKPVNDRLGHAAGDLLLQQVAQRIVGTVRGTDVVARLGGDEFVVLQPDASDPAIGGRVAEKIVASLAEPFDIEGNAVHVGTSIGISVCPRDTQDPEQLLRMADVALYKVKAEMRGGYHYFARQLDESAHRRGREQRLLQRALERGHLTVHFQPQVDVFTGAVIGVEALLRCTDTALAHLSVEQLLTLAVGAGLVREIGARTMRDSFRHARKWRDMRLPPMVMSLNLCAAELRDPLLLSLLENELVRAGLAPGDVEIEITERDVLEECRGDHSILHALRALGVSVAIDDFGTGYSALGYLAKLPVDRIKLDRSFVTNVPEDSRSCAVVGAIVTLAHTLDLGVVAEGIESTQQARFFASADCEAVQGYLYSRPLPGRDMTRWLQARGRVGVQ